MKYLGPLTILLLINVIFYVGLFMLLSGCATVGTFTPDSESSVVLLKFHDRNDIPNHCPDGAVGCMIKEGNVYKIHSVREWCTLNHEIAHVIKGDYHSKGATCKTLPTNGE